MLTCYFGVPGCGKTTLLTKFAIRELRRIRKGRVSIYMFILISLVKAARELTLMIWLLLK